MSDKLNHEAMLAEIARLQKEIAASKAALEAAKAQAQEPVTFVPASDGYSDMVQFADPGRKPFRLGFTKIMTVLKYQKEALKIIDGIKANTYSKPVAK